jgi:hypothetical protein
MYPEETKQAARHARANAEEVKTHNACVELSQAAHQLALAAEICERLERIEVGNGITR